MKAFLILCGWVIGILIIFGMFYMTNKRCEEDGGTLVRGIMGFKCIHEVKK